MLEHSHGKRPFSRWFDEMAPPRDEWRGVFDELLERHLGRACVKAGIAIDELPDVVGEHHSSVLWTCVFEDFLALSLDDGRNIVDDYLKRRGWEDSVSNRAYMAALRNSVMSLYEVSDIVRDELLARDLVRGGEPICVSERSGTHYLKPWDRIAARLVTVGSRTEMAGGVLPFDHERVSENVLQAFRRASKKARAEAVDLARKLGRAESDKLLAQALSDTEILRGFDVILVDQYLARRCAAQGTQPGPAANV